MNPADLALPGISPTLTTKSLSLSTSVPQKSGKAPVPRVDVEPIYTQLKGALGDQWVDYKAALGAFVLGNLNQAELTWVLNPVLTTIPAIIPPNNATASPTSVLQLHNQLVTCIYTNIIRDAPSSDVAPWVVATDKPSTAKNAGAIGASDKAEERLKREIIALHARDRRRVKTAKPDANARPEGGLRDMQDYRLELAARPADTAVQGAGTLSKTSSTWDMETRRKYIQPLAAETLEFPSLSDMQSRIEPICHDEGLIGSAQATIQACAELMEQAAEAYIKTLLGELQSRSRSNRTDCIQTAKYRSQLRKEEDELERGVIQRNATGLLPVEFDQQSKRDPLAACDMRLAIEMRDPFIVKDRFLAEKTLLDRYPAFSASVMGDSTVYNAEPQANGDADADADADAMDIDDIDELGPGDVTRWQGASGKDLDGLMGVLDDCLATA